MKKFTNSPKIKNRRDFLIIFIIFLILSCSLIIVRKHDSAEKESSGLPEIYITCKDKINGENFISGELKLNDLHFVCDIKYRGAGFVKVSKMGYRLELNTEYSLLGMRVDDDWQLFACYEDHTRMRTKLAFEIWRSLLPLNPTAILPKSRYVKLYVNDIFQGLYLFSEKQDRLLFNLDFAQNNLQSSLVLQVSGDDIYYNFRDLGYWEQDYPNVESGITIVDQIIKQLTDFINNTSDLEFFDSITGVYSKFDKLNLIDFYLFNFFIYHKDFWNKNYYLVRNSMPSKFFFIPWDFDYTFGLFFWELYEPNSLINITGKNLLFERLINNKDFMEEVNKRWVVLRTNLWTNNFILGLMTEIYTQIQNLIKIDIDLWKGRNHEGEVTIESHQFAINEDLDFSEEIPLLFNWVIERLDFCDQYFGLNLLIN